LNAANEIAVEAFLNEQIRFTDIPVVIEKTMQSIPMQTAGSLETILASDKNARIVANQAIQGLAN
jgi:1-deoxy-D-xylulose-5-phosphate reductoisomerase